MKRLLALIVLICAISYANPLLDNIGTKEVTEGESLSFAIISSAPDNGTNTFSFAGLQEIEILGANATLVKTNDTHAEFSWDAPLVSADAGETVEVWVSDANSTDKQNFTIEVKNKPAGPILQAIGSLSINEGATEQWIFRCSPPDNGSTVWSLANSSIGSLSLMNESEATYTLTAPIVDVNTVLSQTVSCRDDDSESSETISITVVNLAGGITISDVKFGDSGAQRSNPDEDENVLVTGSFTVTNNEAAVMNNIRIAWPDSSKYNISFVSSSVSASEVSGGIELASLQPGEAATVTLRARIPEDLDSFFRRRADPNDDREVDIGDLTLTGTGITTKTSDILMEAENNLEIYRLYVSVNGDEEKVKDGDEVDKIEPGSKIEIRLVAENKFSSGDKVDIRDVEFNFFADDGDLDEDEDETIGKIKPGDKKESSLSFTLEDDIDEDTYKAVITLEGEDEYGAIHGEQWNIELTVEKEDEKISFRRFDLDDDEIDLCNDRETRLNVKIENKGSQDSDEIVLVVKNKALGFFSRILNVDLDEGDDYSRSFTIVLPEDAKEGTYTIEGYTYFDLDQYDDDSLNSFATAELRVKECKAAQERGDGNGSEQQNEEVVVITPVPKEEQEQQQPSQETGGAFAVAVPKASTTTASERDTLYIGLLVLAYIVVIAIILKMLVSLFRK